MQTLKTRLISKVFKVLGIYENNPENCVKYLSKIVLEFSGYAHNKNLNHKQREIMSDCSSVLMGLKLAILEQEADHQLVKRTVLEYTNKIDRNFV